MDAHITPMPRERMEEMLADYAFGALPEAEVQQFERSLPQYPDIQNEILQIREAFAQFDREDFLERQTRPARTLSVHVQERLARRPSLFGGRTVRHAVPAFGVVLLIAFMFAPGGFFHSPDAPVQVVQTSTSLPVPKSVEPSLIASAITPQDVAKIVEDANVSDPLEIALELPDKTPMSDIDFTNELDLAIDDTFEISDELAESLADNILFPMSDYSLGGGLYDDMQEVEIQQLLEELDNELL